MMAIRGLKLVVAVVLCALVLHAPVMAQDSPEDFGEQLAAACDGTDIPGCVVLLEFPDGTRMSGAWGLSDVERGVPMTDGDLLRAGSVTKSYFAALALMLERDGFFNLDDPVINYVSGDNYYLSLATDPEAVTIRHLLAHESGIPDTLAQLRDSVPWLMDLIDGDGQMRARLPQLVEGEQFAPGEGCRYSNSGYLLLAQVLEAASGRELDALLFAYIFQPLKLKSTYYAATEDTPPQARGYVYADGKFADVTLFDRPELAGAAGSMLASAGDIATFGRALLGGTSEGSSDAANPEGTPYLLSADQLTELMDMHPMEGGGDYGLGLMQRTVGGRTAFGHSGATVGYRAEMWYFPDTGIVAVALANAGSAPLKTIIDKLLDAEGK